MQFAASGVRRHESNLLENCALDILQALISAMGEGTRGKNSKEEGGWKNERTDIVGMLMAVFRKAKGKEFISKKSSRIMKPEGIEKVLQGMEVGYNQNSNDTNYS